MATEDAPLSPYAVRGVVPELREHERRRVGRHPEPVGDPVDGALALEGMFHRFIAELR